MKKILLIFIIVFVWGVASNLYATNYYSYQSGDWSVPNNWTTDPSGTTLVGPAVPGAADQVTILNGRAISTAIARTVVSMTIDGGGTLDLGTTSGHAFGIISGQGLLRMNSTTLPGGTLTAFVSSAGGTIEYYDIGGAGTNLPAQLTYNNLILSNATGSNHRLILTNPSNPTNYTLNGSLTVLHTGAGNMELSLSNAATNIINISIAGSVSIGSGCLLNVSSFNAIHNINVAGDFTNDGTVDLSNTAQFVAATLGAANLTFNGTANSLLQCNSTTDVYTLGVNKGSDPTLLLVVQATNVSHFKFFTNGTGLILTNGTMKLGSNISLTRINGGGNYDISTGQNANAGLWIDGASLILNGGCNAIVVYGLFKITSGTVTIGTEGLVGRISATIRIDGGTVNAEKLRTSTIGGVHIGSFTMTGGTFNVNNSFSGSSNADSPRFSWPYPDQSFTMTGGTINVANPETGTASAGGILIGCNSSNISVTGGTWNVTLPAAATNFNICSTAPFYDLNILKSGAGASAVTINDQVIGPNVIEVYRPSPVSAQPLVVLNNLILVTGNTPTLSAGTTEVRVGKNFTINTSTTYTPGTNTTTFNGTGSQFFTNNGTITTGLHNFKVDKPLNTTLNLAGSAATFTVLNTLTILTGTLRDNGKTINISGDIVNSGNHTGTGSITLVGTGTQTIGGSGSGRFTNLHLNKASGSTVLSANQIINGNLRLANTASILDIAGFNINLALNARIYDALAGTGTSFNNTKMVRSSGISSDGGITKRYGSTSSSFLFPLGTGSDYTPALIAVVGTPTTYGTITTRPVVGEHPNVTAIGRSLTYYWKTAGSGFNLGPATINQSYSYVDSDVVSGGDVDETEYVTARFDAALNTWTSGTTAEVDEATNTVSCNTATFNTTISGEYTAGDNNPTDPFAAIPTFYSMRNGDWNDTNPATTPWSLVGHTGPATALTPGSSNPVIIGDGAANNHTVTVTTNTQTAGNLRIATNSILDVGTSTGHNFGTVFNPAAGSGIVRVSSSAALAEFPGGDWGLFLSSAGGTVEYYSGSVDFTIPQSNPAPFSLSLDTYRNLILTVNNPRVITLPNLNLSTIGTLTVQTSGAGGVVSTDATATHTISAGSTFLLSGGTFRFENGFIQNVNCASNLTINSGATMEVATTGTAVDNTITCAANLTNNGTFDMDGSGGRVCNITFTGTADRSITGTNAGAVTVLNGLTVNKGTSQTPVLTLNVAGTLTTPSNNWLTLQNGSFRIQKSGTFTLTNTAANTYTIPVTAALIVNHASAIVGISQVAADNSDLVLAGKLQILAGTVNVGLAANNNNNDIEYSAAGAPVIDVQGAATLFVNGQIRRGLFVTTGSLVYSQTGTSTVTINGRNANTTRAKLELDNSGSSFTMTGTSVLTIVRGGGGTIYGDLYLRPSISSVTGGTIVFQQGNINANQTYRLDSAIPLHNVSITGTDANDNATVQLQVNPLTIKGTLLISNVRSVLNTAGFAVNIQGNLSNQNTTVTTGLAVGGFRAAVATQVTTFNSSSTNQTISGIAGNLTNFANLVINNTAGSGTVTCSANTNLRVNNLLTITDGTFEDGGNTITVIGDVSNSSEHTSTGSGAIVMAGAAAQTISGDNSGSFGNLTLNNTNNINTLADIRVNNTLTFTNGLIYIDDNLFTFGTSAAVAGTLSATRMIRTNGAISDSGVVKLFNAGASSFTIPIGVTGKFTPVTYNVTANSAPGSIQVRNVDAKHPATTDAAALELDYYWSVRGLGFSGLSLTQTYNYLDADVNGTEASYLGGVYTSGTWTPLAGVAGAVNAAANTITFTGSTITSDYTAGETTEFASIPILYSVAPGGDWSNPATWSTIGPAGPATGPAPSIHPVIISSGHTVTTSADFSTCALLTLDGTLDVSNFIGNNFGTVSGTGTLRISATGSGSFIYPGGNYSSFYSVNGGAVEYYGAANGNLFPQQFYHNLIFSGSSNKNLPNTDLVLTGDLTINAGTVTNLNNRGISLTGNWLNNASASAFLPGVANSFVTCNGANQSIGGSFSTTFYNLNIAGTGIKSLGLDISVNNDLTITSELDVTASDYAIALKGDWINNGTFTENEGTVTFNGTGIVAQTITGSSANDFYNLVLNNSNGLTHSVTSNLINTLTCSAGTFTNSGTFRLLSTATRTARIAPLVTGSYSGQIIMERFAPGGLTGWAHLGAPVAGSKIQAWTDDFPTAGFIGATGTVGSFISIYTYDESAAGNFDDVTAYTPVTSAFVNNITPGVGYWVYLGDGFVNTNDITIDVPGTPSAGAFDFGIEYTNNTSLSEDGWNLIANPYPSAIDWDAAGWTKTNVDDALYIWQADLGQYASYVAGVGTNGGSNEVASSQGFYVKANASSPVLMASENVKTAAQPTLLRTAGKRSAGEMIRLSFSRNNKVDEVVLRFDNQATLDYDKSLEAYKLFPQILNAPVIALQNDNQEKFSIMALPAGWDDLKIPIETQTPEFGIYQLRLSEISSLLNPVCFVLEDLKDGVFYNLSSDQVFSFEMNQGKENRFLLHVRQLPKVSTVPVSCENETDGKLVISNPSGKHVKAEVIDEQGRKIDLIQGNGLSLELSGLKAGNYSVKFPENLVCGTTDIFFTVEQGKAFKPVLQHDLASDIKVGQAVELAFDFPRGTSFYVNFEEGVTLDGLERVIYTYATSGQKEITITAQADGCFSSETMFVQISEQKASQDIFDLRITPSGYLLNYDLAEDGNLSLGLYAANGQEMLWSAMGQSRKGNVLIPMDNLSAGLYLLKANHGLQERTFKLNK